MNKDMQYQDLQAKLNEAYQLKYKIGQGMSGQVWAAWDTRRQQMVALKLPTLNTPGLTQIDQANDIRREAQFLEILHKKHVPHVIGFIELDSFKWAGERVPMLVMEYALGESLEKIVLNTDPASGLPVLELIEIFQCLTETLDATHRIGLVYADVALKHLIWDRNARIADKPAFRLIDWANTFRADAPPKKMDVNQQTDLENVTAILRQALTLEGLYATENLREELQTLLAPCNNIDSLHRALNIVYRSLVNEFRDQIPTNTSVRAATTLIAKSEDYAALEQICISVSQLETQYHPAWPELHELQDVLYSQLLIIAIEQLTRTKHLDQIESARVDDLYATFWKIISRLPSSDDRIRLLDRVSCLSSLIKALHNDYENAELANKPLFQYAWLRMVKFWQQFTNTELIETPVLRDWFRTYMLQPTMPEEGQISNPFELWRLLADYALFIERNLATRSDGSDKLPCLLDMKLAELAVPNTKLQTVVESWFDELNKPLIPVKSQVSLSFSHLMEELASTNDGSAEVLDRLQELKATLQDVETLKQNELEPDIVLSHFAYTSWYCQSFRTYADQYSKIEDTWQSLQRMEYNTQKTWLMVTDGPSLDEWRKQYSNFIEAYTLSESEFYKDALTLLDAELRRIRKLLDKGEISILSEETFVQQEASISTAPLYEALHRLTQQTQQYEVVEKLKKWLKEVDRDVLRWNELEFGRTKNQFKWGKWHQAIKQFHDFDFDPADTELVGQLRHILKNTFSKESLFYPTVALLHSDQVISLLKDISTNNELDQYPESELAELKLLCEQLPFTENYKLGRALYDELNKRLKAFRRQKARSSSSLQPLLPEPNNLKDSSHGKNEADNTQQNPETQNTPLGERYTRPASMPPLFPRSEGHKSPDPIAAAVAASRPYRSVWIIVVVLVVSIASVIFLWSRNITVISFIATAPSTMPAAVSIPTNTPMPTATLTLTDTPMPAAVSIPTNTPMPTATLTLTDTPMPTVTLISTALLTFSGVDRAATSAPLPTQSTAPTRCPESVPQYASSSRIILRFERYLRKDSHQKSDSIILLKQPTELIILDGPICDEGFAWYLVQNADSLDQKGWVATSNEDGSRSVVQVWESDTRRER